MILCHNHPIGKLSPSKEEITVTENLGKTGNLLNINAFNHLVTTRSGYLPMSEYGYL